MTPGRKFQGLWSNADFRRLWVGMTVSDIGTNMVAVVIPIMAAVELGASAFEIGVISAVEFMPYILVSLFVGAWLDKRAKRPIIVLADVVRAAALLLIPVAWWTDALTVPGLIAIVFVIGLCSMVSDIGGASILPSLVRRGELIEANSKLEISSSVSNIGGTTIGGIVIQVLSAPMVALLGVVTSLLAAFSTFRIAKRDERPGKGEESILKEMSGGLKFVFGQISVRTLAITSFLINFFAFVIEPVFLLFITRTLALPPFLIGIVMAMTGIGSLVGALLAERVSALMPLGKLLLAVSAAIGINALLVPLAVLTARPLAVALVIFSQFSYAVLVIIANVNVRSYRTALTPDELQGRMNASVRMLVMSGAPVGALLGGALGSLIGTAWALTAGAVGLLTVPVVIALSPVARVRSATGSETAAPPAEVR
ncbi:MFS transporter [Streptomyces sp. MNU77]|uniref:MFS transporter n=1 Tax=Streptomyces sp. MNU77 TaxID=1573406 RepID=UPI0005DA6A8D|nr:MFS transporter [Streptomyces sp. MNU77]OLO35233.1 MFS transporter [Streptomyces sp. MNU77]